MLGLPERLLGFFRRESVVGAEVAEDIASLLRLDHQAVQPDHALDSLLPNFRAGADIGKPPHHAIGVALVTASALGDRELMVNGNAGAGHGRLSADESGSSYNQ